MVYYFTSTATDPPATIYVGKDKTESERFTLFTAPQLCWLHSQWTLTPRSIIDEELIKYGWEEDVWYLPKVLKFDRVCSNLFSR
jgi:hypothetical protein